MADLPDKMRAVVLQAYHEDINEAIRQLKVEERPVGRPRRGQVLVRIERAPCNPSDLLLLQGKYGRLKTLPTVPGWEGAGTVVASGGGLVASWLNGKRVSCGVQHDRDGTWAEYTLANAHECIPLKRDLTFDQAAGLIVNPMTAMALFETARRGRHRAAIHTAGASQLGRMLMAIAKEQGYPLINIVRRQEQLELLKSLGAEHVLDSSREEFSIELKHLATKLGATIAFEAVAGDMTGNVLNAMPARSTVYVYGALSQQAVGGIDPLGLVFHGKAVRGFFLGNWLRRANLLRILRTARRLQQMLIDGRIETIVQRHVGLDEVNAGLSDYVNNMTGGKVLIAPHETQPKL
jgi:NADPH:quinone reductase-like Zn-dependent oxidoreductase